MPTSAEHSVPVFKMHPAILFLAALIAVLLQTFLPLKFPLGRLMDFPLLVVVYFALMRRERVFGIALGTVLGLLQDALSHGYIGIFGISEAIVGYLAASASTRFELESLVGRMVLTAGFVLVDSLSVVVLQHALLEMHPVFQPLATASAVLVNVALGLVVFQALDRFRRPA